MKKYIFIILITFLLVTISQSQTKDDSIRVYKLGDISVTDVLAKDKIAKSNINTVNYHILQRSDVRSASELQLFIPSGRVRTNSRGESMLFLRGAGERQLGLFFDGVPLNVAWDNRFDLSMLPVDIIGRMDVNKNANSIMFGPNVLGGAVNISTIERLTEGFGGNARIQFGETGLMQASATHDGRFDRFNYIASFSNTKQDGIPLSANRTDDMQNQDLNSSLRNNTDREFSSFYARGEYYLNESAKLGLSVLHITGEKGVGAETHIEPFAARFWRFPEWERTIIASNGFFDITGNNKLVLRSTFWYDIFNQKTDTYGDMFYNNITANQSDKDRTGGARLALVWNFADNQNLSYSANWYKTNHSEQINETPESLFSQNIVSNGLSYNLSTDLFSLRTGAVFDYISTGDAGVFEDARGKTFSDYGVFAGVKYLLTEDLVAFANLSRRTRFPTMREAFSGALDRFIVNPDLKPETGILTEVGINQSFTDMQFELTIFANYYDNLIDQIRLPASEDPLRRRMRVNFAKATIIGADFTFRARPMRNTTIETNFTYMNTSGEQDGNKVDYIDNRPEFLLGFIANYMFNFGLNVQAEVEGVGTQYERNPDDQSKFLKIDGTAIFNLRLAYKLPVVQGVVYEVFVRGNNLMDTYRLSQLGLPEPGRMLSAGIGISM
ncbi:MAG: TonB-dependent receptor [Candidatus Kapabacteria bacterium]|nr:TonB-dependent receptor [Ignavibacteriota bacterium]MCW5885917.1 TonB-dependent receptor [Candidatus Kapabacteria bacterium]